MRTLARAGAAGLATAIMMAAGVDVAIAQSSVYQATLAEPNQKTAEVSTEEVRRILTDGSAILINSRKRSEYVAGHIAGAKNAAPEPGSPPAAFIAAVERLVGGDKAKPLVLYCNGQYCRASRGSSEQLIDAGFTNVRRYQLGIPMWRALDGRVEIELEGDPARSTRLTRPPCFTMHGLLQISRGQTCLERTMCRPTSSRPTGCARRRCPTMTSTPVSCYWTRFRAGARSRRRGRQDPVSECLLFPGTFDALAAAGENWIGVFWSRRVTRSLSCSILPPTSLSLTNWAQRNGSQRRGRSGHERQFSANYELSHCTEFTDDLRSSQGAPRCHPSQQPSSADTRSAKRPAAALLKLGRET